MLPVTLHGAGYAGCPKQHVKWPAFAQADPQGLCPPQVPLRAGAKAGAPPAAGRPSLGEGLEAVSTCDWSNEKAADSNGEAYILICPADEMQPTSGSAVAALHGVSQGMAY